MSLNTVVRQINKGMETLPKGANAWKTSKGHKATQKQLDILDGKVKKQFPFVSKSLKEQYNSTIQAAHAVSYGKAGGMHAVDISTEQVNRSIKNRTFNKKVHKALRPGR